MSEPCVLASAPIKTAAAAASVQLGTLDRNRTAQTAHRTYRSTHKGGQPQLSTTYAKLFVSAVLHNESVLPERRSQEVLWTGA